jgi:hypothetical protein
MRKKLLKNRHEKLGEDGMVNIFNFQMVSNQIFIMSREGPLCQQQKQIKNQLWTGIWITQ